MFKRVAAVTIACLGRDGPPSKMSGGHFRFLCPRCGDMQATVNPRNNLAHCFPCNQNLDTIDLLILLGHDLRSAVALLEQWLTRYEPTENHAPTRRRPENNPFQFRHPRLINRLTRVVESRRRHTIGSPNPSHSASPFFSTIRQTALQNAQIHTVLIRQRMRPQFGPAQVVVEAPKPTDLFFPCPSCGKQFKAPATSAGRKGRCNKCEHVFLIPAGTQLSTSASSSPFG